MTIRKQFLLAILVALWCNPGASNPAVVADESNELRRAYVDSRFGQVHLYTAGPSADEHQQVPLVFFHQTPRSALEFKPLLLEMAKDRRVIAMDTLGYGYSDVPDGPLAMADLAHAMADVLDELGYGKEGAKQVDVFGYHTGVFIASELSILRPDLVRRIVMSGVGYMTPEGRVERYERLPRNQEINEDGGSVMRTWQRIVAERPDYMSIERAVELFLEDIRSMNKGWYAYDAVWSYPIEERFALLEKPVLLLHANEYLLSHSRRTKKELLPDADMIEMLDFSEPVFDAGPHQFADNLRSWLD